MTMVAEKLVGIIGSGVCDAQTYGLAYEVGSRLAQAGFGIVCGGKAGVMAAACEGAKSSGGLTVGILPESDATGVNAWVDIAIPTGMGDARNLMIIRSAIALIAISGEYGTLSEIAFALKLKKPLIGLQTWQPIKPGAEQPDFPLAADAQSAVQWIIERI